MDDDEKLDHFVTSDSFHFTLDLLYMAVGTGGGGREGNCPPPPNILPTQKIQDCKNNDI